MPSMRSRKIGFCVSSRSKSAKSSSAACTLLAAEVGEAGRHVALHAADPDVVGRDARAAQRLVEVPDVLARLDAVEERRHRRELEALAPMQVRWSPMREISPAITRSHWQRGGTVMPKSFSTARQ